MKKSCVILVSVFFLAAAAMAQQSLSVGSPDSFKSDFGSSEKLPDGWSSQGNVSIDKQAAFKGNRSLVLQRAPEDVEKPCSVTSAAFAVKQGVWQFTLATKSDLKSPDNSFNGVVTLQYFDSTGKVLDPLVLVDTFGQKNWQPINRRIEVPEQATAARFHVQLNKAAGRFWIDEISASFVSAVVKKDHRIDRIMFSTAQMGNLLFPEDKRVVDVTVVATKPLSEKQLDLSFAVRDYWGAEMAAPDKVTLQPDETQKAGKLQYKASIDLSGLPLEVGRYYEVQAEIAQENEEPFRNYTSLAILPKPVTKQYKAEEIPFTSRQWDSRISEFFYLTDRVGVRIYTNLNIPLCEKFGMGAVASSPSSYIERHAPGWEKYDEKAMRREVRYTIAKCGKVRPLMISLGNEPPVIADRLAANVAAYKVVYDEVKKIDPGITVISTSVGPTEAFFKAGFQNYCDAVDFHGYSDWQEIHQTFEAYDKLFAKYGGKKPIWSTEIGLNSQGLTRQTVATTLIKKITSFFACGGGNVCWFDLGYPDPDAKLAEDSTTAHNVFDCRYAPRYCPKLDAIAYYNMINGICIKKPVAQKMYGADTYAFLFRDRDHHCLQVLWKEKGRQDAQLPLPRVGKVTAIDIDGRRSELDAGGTGLTLTINEDPLLLLYDSADAPLAERLGAPDAQLTSLPEGVIKGGSTTLNVVLSNGLSAQNIELTAPAFWTPRQAQAGASAQTFTINTPATTAAREGDMAVRIKNGKGGYRGELRARVPVTGRVAVRLEPDPVVGDKPPGVRLILQNHAGEKQEVSWRMTLTSEIPMLNGGYDTRAPIAPTAYFADAAEGVRTVEGKGTAEIVVPLAGVDPLNVYRIKASVTDSTDRTIETGRFIAGFLKVPHAKSTIKLDGSMSESDWKTAPIVNLNKARQYYSMSPKAIWKGPSDLSATLQFLWDEKYLYVGVKVIDDVFVNNKADGDIWAGDGLQFLIDPIRDKASKVGKYDYAMALTKKGPQTWCYLSADAGAPSGAVKDIIISTKRLNANRGDISYLLAIPWSRIAPFKPGIGANLGLCLALNEDDGAGRQSHMDWFGDIESKSVDCVGDLILGE